MSPTSRTARLVSGLSQSGRDPSGSPLWRRSAGLVLGALLALSACSGKGVDSGADDSNDADGDGSPADVDCNDDDSSINPEATEIWYDGIDADCAGDGDFDADGDGFDSDAFGGNDCNDTDASINPDADEVWYDGVDANCDGWNDADADFDGQAAVAEGGDDCDDANASIYRGAPETWYDGVDQNCDEANDYDADGDGAIAAAYAEGADIPDCDDTDDEILPGATEVWYDGVDQDCDEADDYDADGDGETSVDEAPGGQGTDCDDSDPDIRTGTLEALDGRDTDCDGVSDRFSVDEDYGQGWIIGTEPGGGFGTALAVDDFDEDGHADLAVVQAVDADTSDLGDGFVRIFEGSSLSSSATDADAHTAKIRSDLTSGPLTEVAFLLDIDGGDNKRELAVAGVDAMDLDDNVVGAVWIFKHTRLSISADYKVNTNADYTVEGPVPTGLPTGFGATVRSVPDADGDGLADVLIGAPDGDAGTVYFFSSDTFAASDSLTAADADAVWTGTADGDELGRGIATFEDLNSDGYGDMVLGAPGYDNDSGRAWTVLGSGAFSATPTSVASAARTTIEHPATNSRFGNAAVGGDFDGDGTMDVAIGAPRAVTRAGKVYVLTYSDVVGGGTVTATNTSHVTHTGTDIDGYAATVVAAGDVDADGTTDLFLGGPGNDDGGADSGAAWMVVSGLTGDRALANADATLYGGAPDDGMGTAIGVGDVDSDGRADLVYGVPGEDLLGEEGSVYIGFSRY
jgi:hypothetical protein